MNIEVSALHIYPVKSLGGIAMDEVRLEATGPALDRRWMVVDDNGRFVSQRELPRLVLIASTLGDNGPVLHFEGLAPLDLGRVSDPGTLVPVNVWRDHWRAHDAGDDAADWISRATGGERSLRLVHTATGHPRPQRHPERYGADTTTVFADGAPYLVTNVDSLSKLNQALRENGHQAVTMSRFRPNIEVRGLAPFSEHQLGGLAGPGYTLKLRYPCQRCVVTTINPATAVRDPNREPFRTLALLNPMPDNARLPAFGENAVLGAGEGAIIRVGDKLKPVPRPD